MTVKPRLVLAVVGAVLQVPLTTAAVATAYNLAKFTEIYVREGELKPDTVHVLVSENICAYHQY